MIKIKVAIPIDTTEGIEHIEEISFETIQEFEENYSDLVYNVLEDKADHSFEEKVDAADDLYHHNGTLIMTTAEFLEAAEIYDDIFREAIDNDTNRSFSHFKKQKSDFFYGELCTIVAEGIKDFYANQKAVALNTNKANVEQAFTQTVNSILEEAELAPTDKLIRILNKKLRASTIGQTLQTNIESDRIINVDDAIDGLKSMPLYGQLVYALTFNAEDED